MKTKIIPRGIMFERGKDMTTKEAAEKLTSTHRPVGAARVAQMCGRGEVPGAVRLATTRGPVWNIPDRALEALRARRKPGRPKKAATNGAATAPV